MTNINYRKGVVVDNAQSFVKAQELEQKFKILKEKVEYDLTLFTKSLEIAQFQEKSKNIEVGLRLLKASLEASNELKIN